MTIIKSILHSAINLSVAFNEVTWRIEQRTQLAKRFNVLMYKQMRAKGIFDASDEAIEAVAQEVFENGYARSHVLTDLLHNMVDGRVEDKSKALLQFFSDVAREGTEASHRHFH